MQYHPTEKDLFVAMHASDKHPPSNRQFPLSFLIQTNLILMSISSL
jgi:hypothetical protein